MSEKIIIKGMHCQACEKLIAMELDEIGLVDKIMDTKLLDDNKGELGLADVSNKEIEAIKLAINSVDSYSVI